MLKDYVLEPNLHATPGDFDRPAKPPDNDSIQKADHKLLLNYTKSV